MLLGGLVTVTVDLATARTLAHFYQSSPSHSPFWGFLYSSSFAPAASAAWQLGRSVQLWTQKSCIFFDSHWLGNMFPSFSIHLRIKIAGTSSNCGGSIALNSPPVSAVIMFLSFDQVIQWPQIVFNDMFQGWTAPTRAWCPVFWIISHRFVATATVCKPQTNH